MPFIHVAVRAHRSPLSVVDDEVAPWLWKRLTATFPEAISAALMPDHVHCKAPGTDKDVARQKLGRVVNGLRRSSNPGASIEWAPATATDPIDDPLKIARHDRYIALNPARAGLVDDPLAWPWSTYRDVMGCVDSPWVPVARLARILRCPVDGFRVRYHRYVSADPSTSVAGTPLPTTQGLARGTQSLGELLAAALAAHRAHPSALKRSSPARRTFISLAVHCGWYQPSLLAELCGISKRTVRWYAERVGPPSEAAWLCLADRRLRAAYEEPIRQLLAKNRQCNARWSPVPGRVAASRQAAAR